MYNEIIQSLCDEQFSNTVTNKQELRNSAILYAKHDIGTLTQNLAHLAKLPKFSQNSRHQNFSLTCSTCAYLAPFLLIYLLASISILLHHILDS